MIIIDKNEGTKISYEESGTRLTFDDDLSINLKKREQDWPVHIDVCYNEDMELVVGAAAGWAYVAQIDIPARLYHDVTATSSAEDEESAPEPYPLDMNTVTLSLWAIDELTVEGSENDE